MASEVAHRLLLGASEMRPCASTPSLGGCRRDFRFQIVKTDEDKPQYIEFIKRKSVEKPALARDFSSPDLNRLGGGGGVNFTLGSG
ncbi:hypothetical protein AAVH_29584 [Aphelenchoides avenae]|nr:hypothetical protein AAVH_29584 [Aphelenchus avenae]